MPKLLLILGLPNGSLLEPTLELLAKIGIRIVPQGRNCELILAKKDGLGIIGRVIFMRPQDMPQSLAAGVIDIAITGWDCCVDCYPGIENLGEGDKLLSDIEMHIIARLNYARTSRKAAQVVLVCRKDLSADEREEINAAMVIIAAEYPNYARYRYPNADVRFSYGSTEAKIKMGVADFGICLKDSGNSIKENELEVLKVLFDSPVVLIANHNSAEIAALGRLMKGALAAEQYKLVKMNVADNRQDAVIKILPALRVPTVSHLADGSFAIETVVEQTKILTLTVALKQAGATDILAQDMNIVLA